MYKIALGLVASAFVLNGCGQVEATSSIKVTNGISVDRSEYPAVVRLDIRRGFSGGICTGTFVNDSQVVTAAHCVDGRPSISVNGRRAISYVAQDGYSLNDNGGVNNRDIAIVNFPAGTSFDYREISLTTPEAQAPIEIVGYGNSTIAESPFGGITGSGSGRLRAGTNFLNSTNEGMHAVVGVRNYNVEIEDEEVPAGELVATGSGDSGGPLFHEGKLIGVTSGGGLAETEDGLEITVSFFTDVNSESSVEFLRENLKDYQN